MDSFGRLKKPLDVWPTGTPRPHINGFFWVACQCWHASSCSQQAPRGHTASAFKGFKLFKGLEGLRAGKRQAWTPIRSYGCVALGCLLAAG